jgi:hypothetical protein
MNCLSELTEQDRVQYQYGVHHNGDIYFIPYTGWGNTVSLLLISNGIRVNQNVNREWQWLISRDGPVFKTLDEALDFVVSTKQKEVKSMNSPKLEPHNYCGLILKVSDKDFLRSQFCFDGESIVYVDESPYRCRIANGEKNVSRFVVGFRDCNAYTPNSYVFVE